jgi:hypothetical protein
MTDPQKSKDVPAGLVIPGEPPAERKRAGRKPMLRYPPGKAPLNGGINRATR